MTPNSLLENWAASYLVLGLFFASYLFFQAVGNPQIAREMTQIEAVLAFLVILMMWPGVVAVMLDDNGRWKG